jgi:8-oxo-dGTP pyrophosphatase MutT (NUDIX family)
MNLFINDIPITIRKGVGAPDPGEVNHTLDASVKQITKADLINHVYIKNVGITEFDEILELVDSKVPLKLITLHLSVKDSRAIRNYLKKRYKVVHAAGGLIEKKDRYLMIFRMKKWDLPKGKKDPGETSKQTAQREVKEECGIDVRVGKRIVTTWHTYTMNKSPMLKRTRWYKMDLLDDSGMKPDAREQIEEIRWMTKKEVYHALEHSYNSIRFVFSKFYDQQANKS